MWRYRHVLAPNGHRIGGLGQEFLRYNGVSKLKTGQSGSDNANFFMGISICWGDMF